MEDLCYSERHLNYQDSKDEQPPSYVVAIPDIVKTDVAIIRAETVDIILLVLIIVIVPFTLFQHPVSWIMNCYFSGKSHAYLPDAMNAINFVCNSLLLLC